MTNTSQSLEEETEKINSSKISNSEEFFKESKRRLKELGILDLGRETASQPTKGIEVNVELRPFQKNKKQKEISWREAKTWDEYPEEPLPTDGTVESFVTFHKNSYEGQEYMGPFKIVKGTGFAIMFPPNKNKRGTTPPLTKTT